MHLLIYVIAKNKMLGFIVFTLIKFNLFIQEKKFEEFMFYIHVKHELRLYDDRAYVSFKTFVSEYQEVKNNNYPHLSHAYHFGFPNRIATKEILIFNQNYQTYCRFRIEHACSRDLDYFGNALIEAKELHKIYDALDDALTDDFSLFKRRKALHILRQHLGEEKFYQGILPPIVPVWRYEIID